MVPNIRIRNLTVSSDPKSGSVILQVEGGGTRGDPLGVRYGIHLRRAGLEYRG
jgi:hypothetical protein